MSLKLKDPTLLRQQCYVDGQWIDAQGGGTVKVTNPANGDLLGTVPSLGVDETRAAIEAASAAFPTWAARTAKDRANVLRRWHDLMMQNADDLEAFFTETIEPQIDNLFPPDREEIMAEYKRTEKRLGID